MRSGGVSSETALRAGWYLNDPMESKRDAQINSTMRGVEGKDVDRVNANVNLFWREHIRN